MKRLTTDAPDGNFETMLNFVFGKDGWAYIRHDGEREDVLLTEWAKAQCVKHGCDEFPDTETCQEIDEEICDCMMDIPDCPIGLAYCFATQACHLRDRLKMYEDILFDAGGMEIISLARLTELALPLSNLPFALKGLRVMDGKPVWICDPDGSDGMWALVDLEHELCWTVKGGVASFGTYGKSWLAYRRKPEDAQKGEW